MLESWHENYKLIWKLQTHMKIANSYEKCKCQCRNYTPKRENCKLIWKLQTDMNNANLYENYKPILTFWCIVPTWMFAIFLGDTGTLKLVLKQKKCFHLIAVWMTKTQQNNLLQKLPRFINILIQILMGTQSDSYLHLLCMGWRNFFSSCAVVSALGSGGE